MMIVMSMSIMNLYSAESWSISTALCVLSGNAEISDGDDYNVVSGRQEVDIIESADIGVLTLARQDTVGQWMTDDWPVNDQWMNQ